MVDQQVGEVLALLKELGIEQNTLVLFSGDNGGADYFASKDHPRGVHSANKDPKTGVEYRGTKGTLYEGGLRVPFLASWPGKIAGWNGAIKDIEFCISQSPERFDAPKSARSDNSVRRVKPLQPLRTLRCVSIFS